MKNLEFCKIIKNEQLSTDIYKLTLETKNIAKQCKSGQFVMLNLDSEKMLLPRPISVSNTKDNNIELVYHIVGEGTRLLSTYKQGGYLQILGPLGNGFTIKQTLKKIALVGGGIGVAPLYLLAKGLFRQNIAIDIYLGFRETSILKEEFEDFGHVYISTENGAEGKKGNAVELLQAENQNYDEVFACGPPPMLDALKKFCNEKNWALQASLEERMACGVGACVGCVVKMDDKYIKICSEGPVFYV